ncbi:RICIN domain-containing protein [Actinoplanes sp. TFC3]|uniref:RICIN domain-containing protein n=1 Tax=Actinoplanes sp. TFC3 TaxID=1710355 RepID=UPI000833F142|nr:RICIN domain-containing protein [Actinoplanes sp. TFC3]
MVALGGVGLANVLRSDPGRTPQAITDVSLPPWSTAASEAPALPSTSPTATLAPVAPAPTTQNQTPAKTKASSAPATATAPPTTTVSAAPSTSTAPAEKIKPTSTLSQAPSAARTGLITGGSGLCLDLNGGVAVDTNHIQVFDCNGTSAQVWTLETDGTLRVSGKCARAGQDTAVQIITCGGQADAQWRAGQSRTLVNVATNECLTDPSGGRQIGSGVRTQQCTGARDQRWRLP